MASPSAFRATYSDFKLVKTRKVAQLIFEVPLEAVDEALGVVGGMPNPADERWFGIAPLKSEPETKKDKKSWRDMPPSQQAAIRCGEPIFWAFLREKYTYRPANADDAAEAVRDLCVVPSRKDLNTNHKAQSIWFTIDSAFQAWKAVEHA